MPVPLLLEDSGWVMNDVIATLAVTIETFAGAEPALVPSIRGQGEPFAVRGCGPHTEHVADPFKSRLRNRNFS